MRVLGAIAKYLWNRDGARLAIGTIVDGEFLKRDGNTIVSAAGGGGTSDHAALSHLSWSSSGHTGTASRIAAFDSGGATTYWTGKDALASVLTTRGDITYRDATEATRLPIGAANRLLVSDGTDPAWQPVAGDVALSAGTWTVTDLTITSEARGDLLMRGAASWGRLAPGTSGYALLSAGAGADLTWGAVYTPGGTDVAVADGGTGLSSWTSGGYLLATASTTIGQVTAPAFGKFAGFLGWTAAGVGAARWLMPLQGLGGSSWQLHFNSTDATYSGAQGANPTPTTSGTPTSYGDTTSGGVTYTTGTSAGNAGGWRSTADLGQPQADGLWVFANRTGGEVSDVRIWVGMAVGGTGFPNSAAYVTKHIALYAETGGNWTLSYANGATQNTATGTGVALAINQDVYVAFEFSSDGTSCAVYFGTSLAGMALVTTVSSGMMAASDGLRPDCRMIRTASGGTKTWICRGAAKVEPG